MDKKVQVSTAGPNPHDASDAKTPPTRDVKSLPAQSLAPGPSQSQSQSQSQSPSPSQSPSQSQSTPTDAETSASTFISQALKITLEEARSFEKATNWTQAAARFARAAELTKLVTTSWLEAVELYKKAIKCAERRANETLLQDDMCSTHMRGLARLFSDMGRATLSGRAYDELAQRLENAGHRDPAIGAYSDAEREYAKGNNCVDATSCELKRADLLAMGFSVNELSTAIFLYDRAIRACAQTSLLSYSFRDYAMNVFLLSFARECLIVASGPSSTAAPNLEALMHARLTMYERDLPNLATQIRSFPNTHNYKFLAALAKHHDAKSGPTESFEDILAAYEKTYRLKLHHKRLVQCIMAGRPRTENDEKKAVDSK
jgi:tetratricopeptide (TPR) repeat protein